jgi:hypothetical protein
VEPGTDKDEGDDERVHAGTLTGVAARSLGLAALAEALR